MINPAENKKDACFLLLPGFSPDNFPVLGLKETLESKGYDAFPANFFGNAEVDDFSDLGIPDCLKSLSETIDRLSEKYDRIFGIGISLGGALLLEYAKKSDLLGGIVSIGTPFRLKHRKLIAIGQAALPVFYPLWRRLQRIRQLRLLPLGAARMTLDYLENGFLADLDRINTPLLFLHSQKDGVTDYRALDEYVPAIPSRDKRVMFFENGNHVMSYNPMIAAEAIRFIENRNGRLADIIRKC